MIEINRIYCWDSLDFMKKIPDKSIDLVLTDPPYWIWIWNTVWWNNLTSVKNYWSHNDRDQHIPQKQYFDEMIRISKNQIIFWWNYFVEYLKNSPCRIVRNKKNTWNFADCELARTSFTTAVRQYERRRNWMIQEEMWNKETRHHPTQKPISLFRRIIENYSEKWQTVLDPFLWSWTTAIACKELWRNYIWIEKQQEYVNIAEKRIEKTTLSLFS